jgi:Mg2+ and Co2+ transporter CorA
MPQSLEERVSELERIVESRDRTERLARLLDSDARIVSEIRANRHEDRLKEHQIWMEQIESAFARMARKQEVLDDYMTKIAAAQLVTEEKLAGLIDALRRGGNGHG